MSTRPTGRLEQRDGTSYVVIERSFRAPIEDVWAAVTDPDRMARWIGTWDGDPRSGTVQFRMLFEGGSPSETITIRVCEPPHRLHVTNPVGVEVWLLELELSHADGVTTLTLTQLDVTAERASDVGQGWDYYLDRLVDAETGADPALRDFDRDYYPATSAHYTAQFE